MVSMGIYVSGVGYKTEEDKMITKENDYQLFEARETKIMRMS